jgi:hypothetical protein
MIIFLEFADNAELNDDIVDDPVAPDPDSTIGMKINELKVLYYSIGTLI